MSKPRRVAMMLQLQENFRHHSDIFLGTQDYAKQCGHWDCMVDEYVDDLLSQHPSVDISSKSLPYDGVIARATDVLAQQAKRCGIPVVNVWYNSPIKYLPSVFCDFEKAGRLVAEHLLERGLRRFACISAKQVRAHPALINGFHQAIQEHGYRCSCAISNIDPMRTATTWRKFQATLDSWIHDWQTPIGVFVTYYDIVSRHVANACRRNGLKIPEEVALVVGGDEEAVCLNPAPSLSAIEIDHRQIGYEAAQLLDQMMDGKKPPNEPLSLPCFRISARQSTDSFAVEDELVGTALRFIANHSHQGISVSDVAAAVHTSRRTLERKFRQFTGRAVFAEIRRFRIERAKRLLLDSDMQIKQIAHLSGFPSSARLYQVFLQLVHQSPSEFREMSKRK